jgi:phage protein D
MTSVSPISQHAAPVAASSNTTSAAPAAKAAPAASAPAPAAANAAPAATLQLSQQALSKLQAQAKAQGDTDWRPGQKVDWA